MTDGPFSRWHHTHRFYAEDGGTRIIDRVEYSLPLGPVRGLSVAARPVLDLMFAARHRRTKTELE
jgi:ligand-binding SRPBCC domain-containing protein